MKRHRIYFLSFLTKDILVTLNTIEEKLPTTKRLTQNALSKAIEEIKVLLHIMLNVKGYIDIEREILLEF